MKEGRKIKVYFGELTFYDESGYNQFIPDNYDYELGKIFPLDRICSYAQI